MSLVTKEMIKDDFHLTNLDHIQNKFCLCLPKTYETEGNVYECEISDGFLIVLGDYYIFNIYDSCWTSCVEKFSENENMESEISLIEGCIMSFSYCHKDTIGVRVQYDDDLCEEFEIDMRFGRAKDVIRNSTSDNLIVFTRWRWEGGLGFGVKDGKDNEIISPSYDNIQVQGNYICALIGKSNSNLVKERLFYRDGTFICDFDKVTDFGSISSLIDDISVYRKHDNKYYSDLYLLCGKKIIGYPSDFCYIWVKHSFILAGYDDEDEPNGKCSFGDAYLNVVLLGNDLKPLCKNKGYVNFEDENIVHACDSHYFYDFDRQGNLLWKSMEYDCIWTYYDGYSVVSLNDHYGIVNRQGKEIAECIYDQQPNYLEDHKFDDDQIFENGIAILIKDGKYGVISEDGDMLLPCNYDHISFNPSCEHTYLSNSDLIFVDVKGKEKCVPVEELRCVNRGIVCGLEGIQEAYIAGGLFHFLDSKECESKPNQSDDLMLLNFSNGIYTLRDEKSFDGLQGMSYFVTPEGEIITRLTISSFVRLSSCVIVAGTTKLTQLPLPDDSNTMVFSKDSYQKNCATYVYVSSFGTVFTYDGTFFTGVHLCNNGNTICCDKGQVFCNIGFLGISRNNGISTLYALSHFDEKVNDYSYRSAYKFAIINEDGKQNFEVKTDCHFYIESGKIFFSPTKEYTIICVKSSKENEGMYHPEDISYLIVLDRQNKITLNRYLEFSSIHEITDDRIIIEERQEEMTTDFPERDDDYSTTVRTTGYSAYALDGTCWGYDYSPDNIQLDMSSESSND